jgi:hypothetical protein
MSNRKRRHDAPDPLLLAASRCRDCDSELGKPRMGADGIWHVTVKHDDSCPGLNGVTPLPALIALLTPRTPHERHP